MTDRHVPEKFHPGEYLTRELETRKISVPSFIFLCIDIGLAAPYIMDILRQRKPITRPIAIGFEIILGSSAETWMNLQKEYDR